MVTDSEPKLWKKNLNNVRRVTSRHFGKEWNVLKTKLMNSKQTIRTEILRFVYRFQ
jgi:hypothetical protein